MLFQYFNRRAGVGDQSAICSLCQPRLVGDVVLVFYLADNFLDQVLDRHQSVDSAELVGHHCDMRARLPHLNQKVKDRHRRCDEQYLAQNQRQLCLSPLRRRPQQILSVNEPDYVIERLAINRNPRVALLDHKFDDFGERSLDIEGDD